ncbi:MAG: ABC transporter permease [Chlorobi bacterium]|nr:ABC transporter permease [Chlorobiota bacterium]
MSNTTNNTTLIAQPDSQNITDSISKGKKPNSAFAVIVEKEIADIVRSWRFLILLAIIALTTIGSVYTALTSISEALKSLSKADDAFIFLQLFTYSDGTLPSFIVFVSFLGPLLGIGLGFDAVNSEQNKGTLSRILAQPIHRDYIINAKFIASLTVIGFLFFALGFLMMGIGIVTTGLIPTPEEFIRIVLFLLLNVVYVGFWLNMAIWFSVRFKQPATSALTGISVWIFFSIFYSMIVNLIMKAITNPAWLINPAYQVYLEKIKLMLLRFSPNVLYSEATNTLLIPSVRSLGPLTMEQMQGAIPGPLPLGQSIILIWPHVTALIAASVLCFVLAYVPFMRREIRSR